MCFVFGVLFFGSRARLPRLRDFFSSFAVAQRMVAVEDVIPLMKKSYVRTVGCIYRLFPSPAIVLSAVGTTTVAAAFCWGRVVPTLGQVLT